MTTTRKPGRPATGGPGSNGGMTARISIRVTADRKAAVERLAAARGCSCSQLIDEALDDYLEGL